VPNAELGQFLLPTNDLKKLICRSHPLWPFC